jgi:AcrR family transcriptional regulator
MKEPKTKDLEERVSTEEKIKTTARRLFTQKGFDAVRTRDIAEEAGINLALLNYYFRSKQKLFNIIMTENLQQFAQGISSVLNNENMTIQERLGTLVEAYIDTLTKYPDLPLFVLTEMRRQPEQFANSFSKEISLSRSIFFKQAQKELQSSAMKDLHFMHFIANLIGLTIFPFIAAPMLKKVVGIDDGKFMELMQERKKLIPQWLNLIMKGNAKEATILPSPVRHPKKKP